MCLFRTGERLRSLLHIDNPDAGAAVFEVRSRISLVSLLYGNVAV